jgi:NTP pyrophosphatase (non-canonical NTP hydrolase)
MDNPLIRDASEAVNSMASVKMVMNRHKGDITDVDPLTLMAKLKEEIAELEDAMIDGGLNDVIQEAGDVQNFLLAIVAQAIRTYRTRK